MTKATTKPKRQSTTRHTTAPGRGIGARLLQLALTLGLLLIAAGCGAPAAPDRVTIMVPWTQQDEFQTFYSVIKQFEEDNEGIQVDFQVTRALTQQLDASVAAGAPPDLAVLPSVGAIAKYVGKEPVLQELDEDTVDITAYLQPFRGLAQVNGATYAVPVKVDVKSLVWYDPGTTAKPPTEPTGALEAYAREPDHAWCLGLASGPTSGWPGADWIADILLADAGADAYAGWLSGTKSWESPEVRQAWSQWQSLVGRETLKEASSLGFAEASKDMTEASPKCQLAHGARSAMASDLQKGDRFAFAPSAARQPLQVSGDFIGMFTDDNPSARALLAYLAGSRAQQAWVDAEGSSAFSAHTEVTRYANAVQQRIAELIQPRSHRTLCFSAADVMHPDVAAAFYRAVLHYADGTDDDLKDLLNDLQEVQVGLGNSPVPERSICAAPT
ncbi:ABC transporter substrate-binding protein [Streptomyces sp. NBC_01304]|uniref:ABC transporter substrate-binding protein n=1 Tax=Streptomyces sp. NBC_01304 TaxID=2903818 RepID=UPI002E0DB7D8|nr:ABC transporter substrate-binding protein [Streptomyces sp. NBC_01304]